MNALYLIACVVAAGAIVLFFIIVLPGTCNVKRNSEKMIIPLADLAPVWTKYNKEVVPLSSEEVDSDSQLDALDGIYTLKAPEKFSGPQAKQPVDGQPAPVEKVETPAPLADKPADKPPEGPEKIVSTPVESAPAPITAAEVKTPAPANLSLSALAEPLKSLWDDCIVPYKKIINEQGADGVIMALLRLIEKQGHCPSVVIDSKDEESIDMITVRDNLVKVTLRDHTYAVCRYMMGNLKETYHDHEISAPTALVAALAHDIGKIPELRLSGAYNSKDHAKVGGFKLAELLEDNNTVWGKRALRAVNDHHNSSKDDMTVLLKRSDRQARQSELATYTRSYSIKAFEEWFNLKTYLMDHIAPGVNVNQTGKWNAFSFRGTIYARPDWLWEQARKMCQDEKMLDMTFIYTSEKDNAIRLIVSAMRKANITPLLGENYPARKFDIRTSVAVKKLPAMYLTAFNIPDYINTIEMESRKSGFTEIIETVIPI